MWLRANLKVYRFLLSYLPYTKRYVQAEKIEVNTIDQIIEEPIPPTDYQYRNGFSNEHLVLNLTV